MRSITGETRLTGLDALAELVRAGRLPGGPAAEEAALDALEALHDGIALDPEDAARVERLRGELESAREQRLVRLVAHVRGGWTWPWRRRLRDRALLILVMTAKVLAANRKSWVLKLLNEIGYFGRREASERLLLAALPRIPTPGRTRLAARYVELAARVARLDFGVGGDDIRPGTFKDWAWPRRLLHLVARNLDADAGRGPLSTRAGTLEFELARCGEYSRLRRQGSWMARRTLRDLGHRDHPQRSRHRARIWLGAALLCAASLLLAVAARARYARWDDSVSALVARVNGAIVDAMPGSSGRVETRGGR